MNRYDRVLLVLAIVAIAVVVYELRVDDDASFRCKGYAEMQCR